MAGCVGGDSGDGGDDADGGDDGGGDSTDSGDGGDDSTDSSDEVETITPGTAPGFAPFEFRNDDNELVGFDVDLATAVIEAAGYEAASPENWVTIEFDTLIPSLRRGDMDLVAAAMTITEERDEQIDFSESYYEANQAVLVREDDIDPSEFADLEGRRVGAQSGTTGESTAESELVEPGLIDGSQYNSYGNYVLAINDLENGNIDAVVIDTPVANNFADDRSVQVAFVFETGEEFGFGMQEGDDRISDINEGLAEVRDNGTYDELVSEYFQ
ncbi:MAG: ABC-type amino acid transport/signal transduction system, periplasmic component/domain protein [halophilic archaeon J07HX5]|nr:MAG: ABC-type amino acid transport/signal transduction system, periplasmic component/domain protein [halophilic archaeon J07HX5]